MNMSDRGEGRAITCSRITNPITPVQGCIGRNHTRFEDGKKLTKMKKSESQSESIFWSPTKFIILKMSGS